MPLVWSAHSYQRLLGLHGIDNFFHDNLFGSAVNIVHSANLCYGLLCLELLRDALLPNHLRYQAVKHPYENNKNGFKFIFYRPQLQSDIQSVTYDVTLNATEMAVVTILRQKPDSSREEMASKVNKTVRTVQRALDSLKEKGYIRRTGSKQRPMWEVLK